MNIGIVIDGVLTNLEQFQFNYGSKFYFEHEMELKNPRGCSVGEIFRRHGNYLTKFSEEPKFWNRYFEYYLLKEVPRPFASEIIDHLRGQGYRIYLFCTRTYLSNCLTKEKIMKETKLWLIEHRIYFDFLIFSDMINSELIKKYDIELFLDHNPDSIFNISFHIPVACFHAKYNELCRGENIYRVFSWYDFYDKLDEMLQLELSV